MNYLHYIITEIYGAFPNICI